MKAEDVKEHWESGAPTTKCETIKRLEVNAIYNAIMDIEGKVGSVLEVGCGNGENLRNLQAFIPRSFFEGYGNTRFCGMDMVEREPEFDGEFRVGNVLGISEVFDEKFDVIFTCRCLISLANHAEQMKAVGEMAECLNDGGTLIILENFTMYHTRQNHLRTLLGLKKREAPEYNVFMDDGKLIKHAKSIGLSYKSAYHFASLHDIVLYVLLPAMGIEPAYEHELVKAVTKLSLGVEETCPFGTEGQNVLLAFTKGER